MASLGRRPIPPTHPLAHDQISFGPKLTSSSTNSSEKDESSAAPSNSDDPMLPEMNGLEDALQAMAKKWGAKEPQPQVPSPSTAPTTPKPNETT